MIPSSKNIIFNRRNFLTMAGASAGLFMGSKADAQIYRRAALPPWFQINRRVGKSWQNASNTSLRCHPALGKVTIVQWSSRTNILMGVREWVDTERKVLEPFFRLYESRPGGDIEDNPSFVEDFTWLDKRQVRENIWTSRHDPTNQYWEKILNDQTAIDVDVPKHGLGILIQPTMDKPTEEQELIDLNVAQTAQFFNIITQMISMDLMIAALPREARATISQGLPAGSFWLVKSPTIVQHLYPHLYVRVLST